MRQPDFSDGNDAGGITENDILSRLPSCTHIFVIARHRKIITTILHCARLSFLCEQQATTTLSVRRIAVPIRRWESNVVSRIPQRAI